MHALTTIQMQQLTTADLVAMTSTQIIALSTCALTPLQTQALGSLPTGYTPIVLDVNGDGIRTISASSGIKFDLFGDGQPTQIGWVSPSDGLLVRDLNADGVINNGRELFGSGTKLADGSTATDGYQALSELDTNHDGVIDVNDSAFAQLGVWIDANSDGISQAGEVRALTTMGITSISLQTTAAADLDQGNLIGLTSTYQTSDGTSHIAGDVWFAIAKDVPITTPEMTSTTSSGSQALGLTDALQTSPLQALVTSQVGAIENKSIAAGDSDLRDITEKSGALVQAIGEFSEEQYATGEGTGGIKPSIEALSKSALQVFANNRSAKLSEQLQRYDQNGNELSSGVQFSGLYQEPTANSFANLAPPLQGRDSSRVRELTLMLPTRNEK